MRKRVSRRGGERTLAASVVRSLNAIDPYEIRLSMNLSQADFAAKYGFSLAAVRNWEQGRRTPELTAKILLAVIAKHPEVVEEALAGKG